MVSYPDNGGRLLNARNEWVLLGGNREGRGFIMEAVLEQVFSEAGVLAGVLGLTAWLLWRELKRLMERYAILLEQNTQASTRLITVVENLEKRLAK